MGSTNGTKVNGIPVVSAQILHDGDTGHRGRHHDPVRTGAKDRRRPVSDPLLTLLKYIFLAVLYLFFLRVLRAVWVELREPKPAPVPPAPVARARARPGRPRPTPPRPRRGAERLVVVDPPNRRGQEFPLGDELTVDGPEAAACPLPDDTFVSQLHARVFRRDGELFVEDLGSTNGTYLNKKQGDERRSPCARVTSSRSARPPWKCRR